jgi:hypothetical protein
LGDATRFRFLDRDRAENLFKLGVCHASMYHPGHVRHRHFRGVAGLLQSRIRNRAIAYLDAVNRGDVERAYEYIPPSYRATTDLEMFRHRFGLVPELTQFTLGDLNAISTTDTTANFFEATANMDGSERPLQVDLVKEDGQWYVSTIALSGPSYVPFSTSNVQP